MKNPGIRQGINVRSSADLRPPRGWWHGGTHPSYEPAYIQPVIDHTNHNNQLPQIPREGVVDFSLGGTVEVPGRLQRPSGRNTVQLIAAAFLDLSQDLTPGGRISHLEEDDLSWWQGERVDMGDERSLFEAPDEVVVPESILGTAVFSGPTQEIKIGGLAVQPEFIVEKVAPDSLIVE